MLSRRDFFKTLHASFITFVLTLLPGCGKQKSEETYHNPHEYKLSSFNEVDPTLILYKELPPIIQKNLIHMTIGPDQNLYVLKQKKILVFNSKGKLLRSIGFSFDAQLIALSTPDLIILASLKEIIFIDSKGNKTHSFPSLGENTHLSSICVFKDLLLVADAGHRQLWIFTLQGKLKKIITGPKPHGFIIPSPFFEAYFDHEGKIWVSNPGKQKILQLNAQGKVLKSWGKASMELSGFSGCCNPSHFALLPNGSFITAEKGLPRVKLYNSSGAFEGVVAPPSSFNERSSHLYVNHNQEGKIFVMDKSTDRIRIFVRK